MGVGREEKKKGTLESELNKLFNLVSRVRPTLPRRRAAHLQENTLTVTKCARLLSRKPAAVLGLLSLLLKKKHSFAIA